MTERCTADEALGRVSALLADRLKGTPAVIRQLTVHLSRAAGKHIRAASVVTCAMDRDLLVTADAVKAAAAVELLHLATLVHDDIIDDADRRRGIRTLHKKFGEKPAILCGDYLFCLALELASELAPEPELREDRRALVGGSLPHTMSDILLGELRQDRNLGNFALTERQYMGIIGGKTAAMFEGAFYAGFLLSDEPDGAADAYREIGRTVGLIFQLADDCTDIEASGRAAKKDVFSDFKRGVVTLPLIAAMKADRGLSERIKAGIDPVSLRKAVSASGGLRYTRRKIAVLCKKTGALIDALPSDSGKKERVSAILSRAAGVG
jgi:geranylgeranyl pyrophosphate synthase